MGKKHDINMVAAWARQYGLKGYEHLDPQNREKNRAFALKRAQRNDRDYRENRYESKKH